MPVDSKTQALPAASAVVVTDVFPGVSDPDGTPVDRKYTIAQILAAGGGSASAVLVSTGTPEGAVTAAPGTFFFDTVARTLYMKETGTGTTGWIELLTLPT